MRKAPFAQFRGTEFVKFTDTMLIGAFPDVSGNFIFMGIFISPLDSYALERVCKSGA